MPEQSPPPKAIAALKADPSLAAEFERKFGEGSSKPHLAEVTQQLAVVRHLTAITELIEALTAHVKGPKTFTRDEDGNITGFEAAEAKAPANLKTLIDQLVGPQAMPPETTEE